MVATCVASGLSLSVSTTDAAREATENAKRRLAGAPPSYALVFCSPRHSLAAALKVVEQVASTEHVIGCHTAGEFTEQGIVHGSIVVMLVASSSDVVATGIAANVKANGAQAVKQLTRQLDTLSARGKAKGYAYPSAVVLTDGLNGAGERLLAGLGERLSPVARIVGGAAGDEGAFKATPVGAHREAMLDGAAMLHILGTKRWGVGVGHGLKPTTGKMLVTKAKDNVIFEIDRRPAFAVYRQHAAERGVTLDARNAASYMIGNELGVYFLNELVRARAPLSVGADGSISCAASVPEGSLVCILDGDPASMVAAVAAAAREAQAGLGEHKAAGVLVFDCICRGMLLGDHFNQEIAAVRAVLGSVPIAGFLTYGEIARYKGTLDGWHNTTAVVVAIPA